MSKDPMSDLAVLHAFALYEWQSNDKGIVEDIYKGRTEHYKASQTLLLAQYGLSWFYTQLRPDYRRRRIAAVERKFGDEARAFVKNKYNG